MIRCFVEVLKKKGSEGECRYELGNCVRRRGRKSMWPVWMGTNGEMFFFAVDGGKKKRKEKEQHGREV